MIVSDEDVIAALLKDAKKFKSKWELHTNEPTRAKPNVNFLKRTLNNVVKVNQGRMRKLQKIETCRDEDVPSSKVKIETTDTKSSNLEQCYSNRGSKPKDKVVGSSKSDTKSFESRKKSKKKSKCKEKVSRTKELIKKST